MRHAHILRHNKNCETPHAALWFDTETKQQDIGEDGVEHKLWFGWACYSRTLPKGGWSAPRWCRFESKTEFWDFVESCLRPKVTLYLFCHNTNFDLPVLDIFHELPRREWTMTTSIIEAPPTIIKFKRDSTKLVFLDTLNIWRMPLKHLGEMVGLPKLDMPSPAASKDDWDTYGKRDTEIIRKACIDWWTFLKSEDLGGFAPTIAGQAFRTFRHKYMHHEIFIDNNPRALEISRAAYLGGRTECFYIGKIHERVTVLDINSMYPHVMKLAQYPAKLRGVYKRVLNTEMEKLLAEFRVCAWVTVDTDEPVYPVKHEGKLIFPVGRFETALSSPELEYALNMGHLVTCREAAVYHQAPIFDEFVTDMYGRRIKESDAGNIRRAGLWKSILTNLYGKFGQSGAVFERVEDTPDLEARRWVELDADTGDIIRWRQLGGIVQRQVDEVESRDSHPAIAAHVTAEARILLWELVKQAGLGNVFYLDTDALWVNDSGLQRLKGWLDERKLGHLKVEVQAPHAEIFTLKDYKIGSKERHKGVKSSAEWLKHNQVKQQQWEGLKGMLSRGDMTAPRTFNQIKNLSRKYTKGNVGPDGWVTPFRFA